MVRIHEMRSLAFKLFPRDFIEKSGILTKNVENHKFSIWKINRVKRAETGRGGERGEMGLNGV